ncbi:MAG: FAD-dependent oxidoreductase [Nanoarchaeota archaeon]
MIKIFNSEVLDIKNSGGNVKCLKFSAPDEFDFKSGQFVSLSVPVDEKKIRRPFSIASPPKRNFIELCVKIIPGGLASGFIAKLKKGDAVEFLGPAGRFVINENSRNKDIIFIAAGTGLAPFMSMIPDLLENKFRGKIILLKGFRHEENILHDGEFSELRNKYRNFEFHNILSRPENKNFPDKGHVQDFLGKYIPENFHGDFYICGLKEMIVGVKEKLIELGVSEQRIFYEKYD